MCNVNEIRDVNFYYMRWIYVGVSCN